MRNSPGVFILRLIATQTFAAEPVALFNGKDLTGWWGRKTKDPREILAMPADELAALKKASLADIQAHWSVAPNGVLVNDGKGNYLTTDKFYRDFRLSLEYRTVPKADSGIYLRGIPQVQIWDWTQEEKFKHGADKGSGGLWNNSKDAPGKDPLQLMDRPFGEWNQFDITMIGERVTVGFNGEIVVDNAVMENYFDRKLPVPAVGPIQLQTHGGEIRWRNIYLEEIAPEEANKILQARNDHGFKSIFDGKSFNGWQGPVENYEIRDGAIYCKADKGGTILTEQEYEDFDLRFEFKLPPGGNNGIAIRAPKEGDPAWKAFEVQVLDNTHQKFANLKPWQVHGSLYGLAPAHTGYLRKTGEWNFQEIICRGPRVQVILNGTKILDVNVNEVDTTGLKRVPEGINRQRGFVGLAGHKSPVGFRNLRIKPLKR
ncbi:MAG: DUF1080 domain-containing protein [Verrucomicrobiota bacterium]